LNIRKQPYVSLNVALEYNRLVFPGKYGKQEFWLVAPQTEINFANNLFWTTFVQWNSQADNLNINSRVQWRFKPMSDLFLVYSDNYFTESAFVNKNRALILKVNYWLNI
ncbi:MAG: hydrolase, partial [Saprospiraceae bacterium]